MDYSKFVGRVKELDFLEREFASSGHSFVPIWGRRRVGKTTLILRAMNGRGIYFLASEVSDIENLRHFRETAARATGDPAVLDLALDWEGIFRKLTEKDTIITIDEFPYLISANPAIPSIFQRIIDSNMSASGTKLVLCGSSIRMMEDSVMDYRAPLYGRRTGQIHLRPLPFRETRELLPDYSFDDLARIFGIVGGVPFYLLQFDPRHDVWGNIERKIFDPHSLLYQEADMLMRQEFKSPSTYRSILKEIASGRTGIGEIRSALGAARSGLNPYLNNLTLVELIEREVPVTQSPLKSRKGIYVIRDNYLRFFHRYILPYRSLLESGNIQVVTSVLKKDLDQYMGTIFELIAGEAVRIWCGTENIPMDRFGRWWERGEEIDHVGLSGTTGEALFCEFKWSSKRCGTGVLRDLLEKASLVRWGKERRRDRFLVVSRGGFSKNAVSFGASRGMMLWTVQDLKRIFWKE